MTERRPGKRLAAATLKLLAKKPWGEITLLSVAKAAKVPAAELSHYAAAKSALVGPILRLLGDEVTKRYKPQRGSTARDRLFDVSMEWFDVLGEHKPAIRSLYSGLWRDPVMLISARTDIVQVAEWLMTLAEADRGPVLALRAWAYAIVLGRAIPVWLDDDDDLTKTMARLDGDLRRGESVLGRP